jgi:very-short-patch-repair endonuclease
VRRVGELHCGGGEEVTVAEDFDETNRLVATYENLRERLLDLSKKNRMLNYNLGVRSKRHLQFVDAVMEEVYRKLAQEDASLSITPLQEPDDLPLEEKTEEFIAAFEHAKVSNLEYLTKSQALESAGRDEEIELGKLDRELRDRVRSELGLPARPKKAEINRADHARRYGIDPNVELGASKAKPSHDDAELQTLKFPDELERILSNVIADARLSEQEMGISTLFLAFGFLEWYDADASDKKLFAPLLLLPVTIEAKKLHGRNLFSIAAAESVVETNLSLQKLLEKNFHRELPIFETTDEDEAGSVEAYLDTVRVAIKDLGRWQIHRWLVLGHFAFGRFAVYADLNPENWAANPVDHSLIGSILKGSDGNYGDGLLFGGSDDYLIDDPEIEALAPYLIQDADASQHSALIDAMKGHNLVIQGPPGTGKSQTIANIIANGLAADKTILFVAEKQAALDVVKRRLERSGIGEFCLELHSDKASPKTALQSLERRLKVAPVTTPAAREDSLRQNRKQIAGYLEALHDIQPGGRTVFELIWKALRGSSSNLAGADGLKAIKIPDALLSDAAGLSEAAHRLALFAGVSEAFVSSFGHPSDSPWYSIGLGDIGIHRVEDLLDCLGNTAESARQVAECIAGYGDFGVDSLADLLAFLAVHETLKDRSVPEETGLVAQLDGDGLGEALKLIGQLRAAETALAEHPVGGIRDDGLKIAIELSNLPVSFDCLERSPSELASHAAEIMSRNQFFSSTMERFAPALASLGFDYSYPVDGLEAIAKAVIVSTKIPAEYRSDLNVNRDIDEKAFDVLRGRWLSLMAEEKGWRQKLRPWADARWPDSLRLRDAAEVLGKGNLSKALAALTGSSKWARELVSRLGLSDATSPAQELRELARHVDALEEFDSDDAADALLAERWDGTNTAFDRIAFALKARKYFSEQIGDDLTRRLIAVPPSELESLHQHLAAAIEFLKIVAKYPKLLGSIPTALAMEKFTRETDLMRRIVDVDPGGCLSGSKLSVRQIAYSAELRFSVDRISKVLDASPLKYAVDEFAKSPSGIDRAYSALEWLRAVRGITMPPDLAGRLRSASAPVEWATLKALAGRIAAPLATYNYNVERLGREFGMTDYGQAEPDFLWHFAANLLEHRDELREYLALLRERVGLEALGLKDFLKSADQHKINPRELPRLLETLVAHRGAGLARRSVGALHDNTAATLEVRRKQFADRDRIKIEEDRLRIKAKLLTKKPLPGSSFGRRRDWTEMAFIKNEFGKQTRFAPVRTLLSQAGRSIQALTPCFMMSPMSLAKFMKPQSLQFDILIIDEASQMRPEDALGAMLRSKQIVVVGDQKQLPPTDFFARSAEATDGEDDEYEDIDDESILESCQKTFGQRRSLKWHYRSHCESLIRFSNEQFYQNELVTFPASKPDSFAIDLISVGGVFQARCNPVEANRVAEEAVTFMRHHADRGESDIPSLGIVAINIQQRNLIQEELNRLVADDILVEQYCEKVAAKGEELFVKNLENVQGDERDFIFVSMTYGPEPDSSVLKQRFGPINRKQGHRRLNVLFSRARMRIGLFSSFGSADVVPGPNSSEGVHVLRKYLEYAEMRGRISITQRPNRNADSDFEVEVAERLRSRGYVVDYQVGVSGYRIDLGVRHPDHPEYYLAGIECDGAAYHSSKSARDRDRLREEVLRDKGWEIARVWSTDWFDNPTLQTARLVQKLESLRLKPPTERDGYVFSAALSTSRQNLAGFDNAETVLAAKPPPMSEGN